MDNVLFVPSVRESEWVKETVPGLGPAELPVAGRRIIDYMLEGARRFDILMVEILDWDYSAKTAASFIELTQTGYPVFYAKGEGARPKGLSSIEGLSSPLTQTISDDLVVVWGLCLPGDGSSPPVPEPVSQEEADSTPPGVYRRKGGKWMRIASGGTVVDGPKAWLEANFSILHNPGMYTLPGYSAEKDVYLGRNVVLERGTEVAAPALLQDNCWCARNVTLSGDTVIGSGSFISEGATLKRTVVCDDTYVGEGLDLENKIVIGNRIVDPETGAWVDVEEQGVARRISAVYGLRALFAGIWNFLLGNSRGRRR